MNITTNPGDDSTVIVLEGRFDAHEAPHAASTFDSVLDDGQSNIEVSLADVQFIGGSAPPVWWPVAGLIRPVRCPRLQR